MSRWIFGLFWIYICGCLFAQVDTTITPNTQQGILELPKGIAVYVTDPDGVEKLIDPNNGRALLPAGTYRMQYWMYRKKDTDGNLWRLQGYGGSIQSFKVGEEPTRLDIKPEPIKASITVRAWEGEYVFRMKLVGPSGETVYIYENDKSSQPPPILITNQDKSFSVSMTGKYG